MTTSITLEDGRILGTSNGEFDALIELVVAQLESRPETLPGLTKWLLDQRCVVRGPGVGYLDFRELSPRASRELKSAFASGVQTLALSEIRESLCESWLLLERMWQSIDRGEPAEALTSAQWKISPWNGEQRGPGWQVEPDQSTT